MLMLHMQYTNWCREYNRKEYLVSVDVLKYSNNFSQI